MTVVIACGLLIAVGLIAVWRWGGLQIQPPPARAEARGDVARRYVWYLAVATVSGLGAGVLVAGAQERPWPSPQQLPFVSEAALAAATVFVPVSVTVPLV